MVRGLYVAANSLLVQEAVNDTIAANLANVSTSGYRRAVTSIESFPAVLARAGSQAGTVAPQLQSTAAQAVPHLSARQTTDFSPGPQQQTGNPCDFAIEGPGFFVVQTPNGEAYTRAGSFTLDNEGYLTTPSGHKLLGDAGPIRVTGRSWRMTRDAEVVSDNAVVDRIRVVELPAQAGSTRVGENLFAGTAAAPTAAESVSVRQGCLEGSNVNAVSEMVSMITALRAFETNQKVVQAVDSTLDRVINEVGRV